MTKPTSFSLTLGILAVISSAQADVILPSVLSSHMVLQREAPLHIWGTADPKEKITVKFSGKTYNTVAKEDGNWLIGLPAFKADGGQKHTLTVAGKNTIILEDILIGDVWIGSGQSNMEWSLKGTEQGKKSINEANHPQIRLFHIPKVQANAPAPNVKAKWNSCTPQTVPNFSAVLYHFGKEIHEETDVPMGLVNSSWGGSPIEPWIATDTTSGKMYNGMIAPITQFEVRGTIWYQGETNVIQKNGLAYREKMKALIEGWRTAFENKSMPFYFVQIAPWGNERYATGELPALWEAQCATLKIPHTGMAVTTDIVHDIKDIHPRNKRDVGNRLASWALAKNYKKEGVVYSGPLYKSIKIEGGKIRIAFAHVAKGLKSRDGNPLNEFQIAGADEIFVPAEASIDGATIVVSAKNVNHPKHVRFGWHRSANPNLINSGGLPASPFQSKNWSGGTGE
jgi:sialate O-acetylesterase